MPKQDRSILEAALVGFEHKLVEVEKAIVRLKRRLEGAAAKMPVMMPGVAVPTPLVIVPKKRHRKMSAGGRAKIAAAQKKRWSKARAAKKSLAKKSSAKTGNPTKQKAKRKATGKAVKVVGTLAPF